jgi:Domain of unknown function (DUF4831)
MKLRNIVFTVFIIALVWSCASVPPVTKVIGKDVAVQKGIYYCLPKNEVVVNVTVSRTETGVGAEFKDYADELGWEYKSDTNFKIEGIEIKNMTVADQSQWYHVEIKPHLFRKINLNYESNGNGVPNSVLAESQDQSVEITTEVLKFAAELASKFIPIPLPDRTSLIADTEKLFKDSISNTQKKEIIPEKAVRLINEYKKLKDNQLELISNQSKHVLSVETFKLMNESITKKMNEIEAHFVGKERIKKINLKFVFNNLQENKTIFFFDKKTGINGITPEVEIPQDFISLTASVPYIVELDKKSYKSMGDTFQLKNTDKKHTKGSFFYNIPGEVSLKITKNKVLVIDTTLLMTQAGVVGQLPIKAGFFKTKYDVKFDAATGALTKISINGEPPSGESIGKAGESLTGLIDKVYPDELEQLKKQIEILEQQQKLEELLNKK